VPIERELRIDALKRMKARVNERNLFEMGLHGDILR
jgi:hypothetical protein